MCSVLKITEDEQIMLFWGSWCCQVPFVYPVRAALVTSCSKTNGFKHMLENPPHVVTEGLSKMKPTGNPRATSLPSPISTPIWMPISSENHGSGRVFWLFCWPAKEPGEGEESSSRTVLRWKGMWDCLKQPGGLHLPSLGGFRKQQVLFWRKRRERELQQSWASGWIYTGTWACSTKLSFFPRFISFIEGLSVQKYIEELI